MDILQLVSSVGIDPGSKEVASTKGGEWHMPCPKCGGEDRFHVWPNQGDGGTWWCRQCDKGGDLVEFLVYFKDMSYGEAFRYLGKSFRSAPRTLPKPPARLTSAFVARPLELPSEQWRVKAAQLVEEARVALADKRNQAIQDYLDLRGIYSDFRSYFNIGWVEGEKGRPDRYRARSAWGVPDVPRGEGQKPKTVLWIPQGILIPTYRDGELLSLRVRISKEDRRRLEFELPYYVLPGGVQAPMAAVSFGNYLVKDLNYPKYWIVVESQLDAMAIASNWGWSLPIGVVSVLSASGKPDEKLHKILERAERIFVSLDYDDPGNKASHWWTKTYKQAKLWPTPAGKDPGEYRIQGGDLGDWIWEGMPQHIKDKHYFGFIPDSLPEIVNNI